MAGFPVAFSLFFPSFFNGVNTGPQSIGNFDWGHLWFLAYLFIFSALALPLFLSLQRKGAASRLLAAAGRFASMRLILLPALWTGFLEALFRPGWPGALNLVNDWALHHHISVLLPGGVHRRFRAGIAPGH